MSNVSLNILSKDGLKKIKDELNFLIKVKRPEIIKQIQEAREQGDLSENADYDSAKNEQAKIESRIQELENIINNANVYDKINVSKNKGVQFGNTVTFLNIETNEVESYTLVGRLETDPSNGKISMDSPLAKAVLGRNEEEVVEVRGIEIPYKIKILKIN